MGCDFFFEGNLPDENLQEKVIDFVRDFFNKIDLVITPDTARNYPTEFHLPSIGLKYDPRKEQFEEYSFNFFGIIPDCKDEYGISDHGQFIFNRNDNGRLVRIMRLPDSFGINCQDENRNQSSQVNKIKYLVILRDGGYDRLGGGMAFALLLTICKLRWWPDLKMGDDYENCVTVAALIAKWDMKEILKDEALDFPACYQLFDSAYEKEFPLPPEAEEISVTTPYTTSDFVDLEIIEANHSMLELSVRLINIFNNNGIITVNDILKNSVDDLRKLTNCGKRSVNEIEKELMNLGLLLRDSAHEFEIIEEGVMCTTIKPEKSFRSLAQWYVNFTARIKPFLKAGNELFDS